MHERSRVCALTAVICAGAGLLLATAGSAAEVWVTNMQSADVWMVDPESRAVIAEILAEAGSHGVAYRP